MKIQSPPQSMQLSDELEQYFVALFGKRRTHQLAHALRQPGDFFFLRTNLLQTTNDELLDCLASDGVHAEIIDPQLGVVGIPIHKAPSIPRFEKIITADKMSSENILLGSHLYRPGVLRADRFTEGDRVTIVNPRGHIVGSGIAAGNSKDLLEQSQGIIIKVLHPYYALPSLTDLMAYRKGLFYSQSLSAQLVAPILDPQPNELIVDFCAAPGGKSTHIAQLARNHCQIIAVDRSERRLVRLSTEAERLGITCITPFIGRANEFVEQNPNLQADRILVDPPCTALGVRPKLYDETTSARIQSTASYQRMILDSALTVLRPGGLLVYSTCTLTIEENEHNIQYLMKAHGFTLEPQSPHIGSSGIAGPPILRDTVQRIFPDVDNLPGYFIAKLRKPH